MCTDAQKSADVVKGLARQVGFELVGIGSAEPLVEAGQRLSGAVKQGLAAGMNYLGRNVDQRSTPKAHWPWAKSIISVGINYNWLPPSATGQGPGLISRYALGRDYHLVLGEKLKILAGQLQKKIGRQFRRQVAVDTLPLMEKPLAERAGLGFAGKNTLIINEEYGSWIFLGELITDLELAVDLPAENKCGSCRACIDACPTGALSEPGVLDAEKCLSYLTVEHKGQFPPKIIKEMRASKGTGECLLFGCDICQEVCPFNQDRPRTKEKEFEPREELLTLTLEQAKRMTESQFAEMISETAMSRLSYKRFQRNVRTGNREA